MENDRIIEICDVEKRRTCDSFYIKRNKVLLKELLKTREELLIEKNKLILINDYILQNKWSEELKKEILGVIENEKI
jgi:hypothetical protein